MKIFKNSLIIGFVITLFSCDNEVDLNAEFIDTPVVFSLLTPGADTQYVRVTRGFLKDGESAIDLAQDPSNLYYDTLEVFLTDVESGNVFSFNKIEVPKEPGVFSTETNRVYMLENQLNVGSEYKLDVTRPGEGTSTATASALGQVELDKPDPNRPSLEVSFVNNQLQFQSYDFQFNIGRNIAKFEAYLYFYYDEVNGSTKTRKEVKMPIGSFTNSNRENLDEIEIFFPGDRFFRTIANEVEPTSVKKEIPTDSTLMIEIYAADETLIFYQDLNGPIEGLAQVRPEFSNIENGIGLFASRSVVKYFTRLNGDSRNELKIGSLTGNHNFSDP